MEKLCGVELLEWLEKALISKGYSWDRVNRQAYKQIEELIKQDELINDDDKWHIVTMRKGELGGGESGQEE